MAPAPRLSLALFAQGLGTECEFYQGCILPYFVPRSCVLLLHQESRYQLDPFQTCIGCIPSVSGKHRFAVPDNRASPYNKRPSLLMTLMALLLLMKHITLFVSDQTLCICHRSRCHLLIRSAQSHTWVQPFFIYIPKCHTQVYAILDKRDCFGCSVEQSAHNITCKVQAALKQQTSGLDDSSFCEGRNTTVVVSVATV